MKLYATRQTKTQAWAVYDDNGTAYIVRTGRNPLTWHAKGRSAAEWVAIQRKPSEWIIAD